MIIWVTIITGKHAGVYFTRDTRTTIKGVEKNVNYLKKVLSGDWDCSSEYLLVSVVDTARLLLEKEDQA